MTTKKSEPAAVHNPKAGRFEIESEGLLSVLEYTISGKRMIITETEVPEALSGQGIGSHLARAGLDYARTQGKQVVPACEFIEGYLARHPEYQDLLKKG